MIGRALRTAAMLAGIGFTAVACGPSADEALERAERSEAEAADALADVGIALDPPAPSSPWTYRTERDELTGQDVSFACTLSTNTIRLNFPYDSQQLSLCLRRHPRYGRDAIIQLPRGGQFVCRIRGCTVQVRMGDGTPSGYTVLEAADGSSDTLFISNYSRFLRGVRGASEVAIAADYYRNGNQTAVFNTANLEWESPAPARESPASPPPPPPSEPTQDVVSSAPDKPKP